METSGSPAWFTGLRERIDAFNVWCKSQGLKSYDGCFAHQALAHRRFQLAPGDVSPEQEDAILKHCTCPKKKTRQGNGAHVGAFAFTLTKSTKDPYSVGDMLTAVRKIMSQKSCPVVKYAWYYEEKGRDENGDPIHPHIHGMYETATGGRIETKHWKRAWPIWDPDKPMGAGFRGGYHRPVRDSEGYSDYIKKDGGMSEHRTEQTD